MSVASAQNLTQQTSAAPESSAAAAMKTSSGAGLGSKTASQQDAQLPTQQTAPKIDHFSNFGKKKDQKAMIIHRDAHSIVLAGHHNAYKVSLAHLYYPVAKLRLFLTSSDPRQEAEVGLARRREEALPGRGKLRQHDQSH